MLVLSLRDLEGVQIDGPCHIVVVRSSGGQVRLGFDADKATAILRDNAKNPLPSEYRGEDKP